MNARTRLTVVIVALGATALVGCAPPPDPGPSEPPIDLNADGTINCSDLGTLLDDYGQTGSGLRSDLDDDGSVGLGDLSEMLSRTDEFDAPCAEWDDAIGTCWDAQNGEVDFTLDSAPGTRRNTTIYRSFDGSCSQGTISLQYTVVAANTPANAAIACGDPNDPAIRAVHSYPFDAPVDAFICNQP